MNDKTLQIVIAARDQASAVLKGVSGNLKKLGTAAKDSMGDALKQGAVVGVAAITAVAGAAVASVKAYEESQLAVADLNATLKSTKGIAGVTSGAALDLAHNLQQITRFDDEAILGGENILLTYTKIGKNVFPEATKASLNLATKLGMDVPSAARILGKALNSPAEGLAALTRLGIRFNDKQQEMIQKMEKSGDVAGAQSLILKELETRFGGVAEAAGNTFAGQLDKLKNNFNDIQEEVGFFIIKALNPLLAALNKVVADVDFDALALSMVNFEKKATDAFNKVMKALQPVFDFVSKHKAPILAFLKTFGLSLAGIAAAGLIVVPVIAALTNPLIVWSLIIATLITLFQKFKPQIMAVWNGVKPAIDDIVLALTRLWSNISTNLIPALQKLWDKVSPVLIPALKALAVLIGAAIYASILLVIGVINLLVVGLTFFANTITAVWTNVQHFFKDFGFLMAKTQGDWTGLWTAVSNTALAAYNFLKGINWGNLFVTLAASTKNISSAVLGDFTGLWTTFKNLALGAFNFLKGINWANLFVNIAASIGHSLNNSIMGLLESAINGAFRGFPGHPTIKLPRFAKGVENFTGGFAIVGEKGPELAYLPKGTSVTPNDKLGGMGHVTINGNITLGDQGAVDAFFKRLSRGQELAHKGLATGAY